MYKRDIFKAFSSDIRMKIFKFLLEGNMCVSGIVKKLNVSQPTVTQHLKILQQTGLVKSKKIGYWMHYSIDEPNLEKVKNELNKFIETLQIKDRKCKTGTPECSYNKSKHK